MLFLAKNLREISFAQLMEIYEEGNLENGGLMHPDLPESQQIMYAEQSFYQFLAEGFFPVPGAVYAVWVENGKYVSALRLEPYMDGLLLEALETAPNQRRKGYAEKLVRSVQAEFSRKIYSHVSKRNKASLAIHEKCGFRQILDYARYIDGSGAHSAITLCYP